GPEGHRRLLRLLRRPRPRDLLARGRARRCRQPCRPCRLQPRGAAGGFRARLGRGRGSGRIHEPGRLGKADMSTAPHTGRAKQPDRPPVTVPRLAEMWRAGEPIVMVTAYDFPSAQAVEEAGVDIVLVGDTAAMVVLGYDGTPPIRMDEMI